MSRSKVAHLKFAMRGFWALLTKPGTKRMIKGGQLVLLDYPV